MSNGLFQNLPGAHEMSGANALPTEPWLLPISDRAAPVADAPDVLMLAVRQASRRFWIAANALCAVLALLLTAQVATDWHSPVSRPTTGQIADASPPTLAAEKAALTGNH